MIRPGFGRACLFCRIGRRLFRVLRNTTTEWFAHRASSKGAALAFYTLFSTAPILILVIAVFSLFFGAQTAQGELRAYLNTLFGQQAAEAIQLILASAHDGGRMATFVASVLFLFGATSAFAELKSSLDEIWHQEFPRESTWWDFIRTRIVSFGLILVLAFLVLLSFVFSAFLAIIDRYLGERWQDMALVIAWAASAFSFGTVAVLVGIIFKTLPRVRLAWRDVAVGALGTALLLALGKLAIGLYIRDSGIASSFGAAGSMIALLLWAFYSAQILLFGAEFARQYALQIGSLRHLRCLRGAHQDEPPYPDNL